MERVRRIFGWALGLGLLVGLLTPGEPARADGVDWPLPGASVRREFDPPDQPWLAGHRGVDLTGRAGDQVRAPRAGTVSFAGMVAGRPVLVISHGAVRTTLEPVTARVAVGTRVQAGQPVGVLEAGHCSPADCLHWGLRRGDDYLDPREGSIEAPAASGTLRLLPLGAAERVVQAAVGGMPPAGSGRLRLPSTGPVTSRYGMRRHPTLGVIKLHDGLDLGAPCGAPIVAAADGRVVAAGSTTGYGNRVVLEHDPLGGASLATTYNHASVLLVSDGDEVRAGEVLARVGSTGFSTGCHLHFMVLRGGSAVDPEPWLR